MSGNYQHINASVAIALSNEFLKFKKAVEPKELDTKLDTPSYYPVFPLTSEFLGGLAKAEWPGRAQTLTSEVSMESLSFSNSFQEYPNTTFFLDGAHTIESTKACLDWFESKINEHCMAVTSTLLTRTDKTTGKLPKTILCFNCKYEKDSDSMLNLLRRNFSNDHKSSGSNGSPSSFDYSQIYFVASKILSAKDHSNDLTNVLDGKTTFQEVLRDKWVALFSESSDGGTKKSEIFDKTFTLPTINSCLDRVKEYEKNQNTGRGEYEDIFVLVTGSLYLVGGFLELLGFNTTPK